MIPKIRRFIRLHKPLVAHSILLFIGVIGLFTALVPSVQKSIMLVRDLQTMNKEIGSIQKKVTTLSLLDEGGLEKSAHDVLSAVPADKSVSTLLSTVEALAGKNNLYISDMSVEGIGTLATGSGTQPTQPEGNSLSETITLQGELIQLRNFLSDCVRVRRLMRVKNMEITSLPKSTLITAKITLEFFYLPFPATLGKASDPLEPFSQKELGVLAKLASYPVSYAGSMQPIYIDDASVTPNVPTTPAVSDPFFPVQRTGAPGPNASPTPRPTPIPTSTPKPTSQPTSSPTSFPTPTP